MEGFGVSTGGLEKFIPENGENMKSQFVGVFSADQKTDAFTEEIKNKEYPFMIANTDPINKGGQHWWSFMDTDEKDNFFL